MNIQDNLQRIKDQVQQQRDELAVQISLAKMEARQEWEEAEGMFQEFRSRLDTVTDEAKDAAGDVLRSAQELGEEIKRAYERIKAKL